MREDLFILRLWECECVSVKENFRQLEELSLHSEVNPNPRVQQSGCHANMWL